MAIGAKKGSAVLLSVCVSVRGCVWYGKTFVCCRDMFQWLVVNYFTINPLSLSDALSENDCLQLIFGGTTCKKSKEEHFLSTWSKF